MLIVVCYYVHTTYYLCSDDVAGPVYGHGSHWHWRGAGDDSSRMGWDGMDAKGGVRCRDLRLTRLGDWYVHGCVRGSCNTIWALPVLPVLGSRGKTCHDACA